MNDRMNGILYLQILYQCSLLKGPLLAQPGITHDHVVQTLVPHTVLWRKCWVNGESHDKMKNDGVPAPTVYLGVRGHSQEQ